MNAITTTRDESTVLRVMRETLYPGARPESVGMVLAYCQARGLDPMLKPVHIVPMYVTEAGQKGGAMRDVPMPGIALYRIQASRSGQYAGKSEPEFGPDETRIFTTEDRNGNEEKASVTFPKWCKVTVSRIVDGEARPFTATEYWIENYATASRYTEMPNAMWKKRAYGQLAKCAEAQALRMAFPELTGGEPTAEEMEGKVMAPEPRHVQNLAPETPREPPPADSMREAVSAQTKPLLTAELTIAEIPVTEWRKECEAIILAMHDAESLNEWWAGMEPMIAGPNTRAKVAAMVADQRAKVVAA
jgi:phage recombination protein Bet